MKPRPAYEDYSQRFRDDAIADVLEFGKLLHRFAIQPDVFDHTRSIPPPTRDEVLEAEQALLKKLASQKDAVVCRKLIAGQVGTDSVDPLHLRVFSLIAYRGLMLPCSPMRAPETIAEAAGLGDMAVSLECRRKIAYLLFKHKLALEDGEYGGPQVSLNYGLRSYFSGGDTVGMEKIDEASLRKLWGLPPRSAPREEAPEQPPAEQAPKPERAKSVQLLATKEIYGRLCLRVIGQERLKRALAVAGRTILLRMRQAERGAICVTCGTDQRTGERLGTDVAETAPPRKGPTKEDEPGKTPSPACPTVARSATALWGRLPPKARIIVPSVLAGVLLCLVILTVVRKPGPSEATKGEKDAATEPGIPANKDKDEEWWLFAKQRSDNAETQEDKIRWLNRYLEVFPEGRHAKEAKTAIEQAPRLALEQATQKAQAGDAEAQVSLAEAYYFGRQGVRPDKKQALAWFEKAGNQGHAGACLNAGVMHKNGEGTAADPAKAFLWYKKSAALGDADAFGSVAHALFYGEGVPTNRTAAVGWYTKSADAGDMGCQFRLGLCYGGGYGVPKNQSAAARWYRTAAKSGHAEAQHMLGLYYAGGMGVKQDGEEAIRWMQAAAGQGHEKSKRWLADIEREMKEREKREWQDIVRRGNKQSPPDKQAAMAYVEVLADNIVSEWKKRGRIISAKKVGFIDFQYFRDHYQVDAKTGVAYEWEFMTKGGFRRTTTGWLMFIHDKNQRTWLHQPAGDKVDGLPYYK